MIMATAITTGLCEILKQTFPRTDKYMRIIALLVGAGVGYLSGMQGMDLLIVGLSAQGLYSASKPAVTKTISVLSK